MQTPDDNNDLEDDLEDDVLEDEINDLDDLVRSVEVTPSYMGMNTLANFTTRPVPPSSSSVDPSTMISSNYSSNYNSGYRSNQSSNLSSNSSNTSSSSSLLGLTSIANWFTKK
ncbi:hypothetical protein TrLO_g12921 [Triparma laevis f. longispina]|uniref:Uncharacterized protein n=1 Tax=Triparma laevis f. longispina TaxID=1714387 RepID=A0A9W7FQX0_9STRA|nr:hypothetical protein TrLO_g12921 [Triparma laevis f. longispina]